MTQTILLPRPVTRRHRFKRPVDGTAKAANTISRITGATADCARAWLNAFDGRPSPRDTINPSFRAFSNTLCVFGFGMIYVGREHFGFGETPPGFLIRLVETIDEKVRSVRLTSSDVPDADTYLVVNLSTAITGSEELRRNVQRLSKGGLYPSARWFTKKSDVFWLANETCPTARQPSMTVDAYRARM